MEENYTKILWEGYGLRYHGGNRTRTGFVCKTDHGLREVRKISVSKEDIQFEQDVKEYLYQNGFACVSRFCLTTEGKPYYTLDGINYVIEQPMGGEAMEETEEGFLRGAALLGMMHRTAQGLKSTIERSNLGKLPAVCAKRKNELVKIRKRIDHQSCFNPLDLMVRESYKECMEHLEEAQEILSSNVYKKLLEQAKQKHTFCHNAFKGENIRCGQEGNLWVTGFGKCAYDTSITDLASYFRRYIKKTQGNVEWIEKMLKAYEKECPLSKEELLVLIGLCTYPEKFLRLCNEYYNRRRVCISPAMLERMQTCIASQKKNDILVKSLKNIMDSR